MKRLAVATAVAAGAVAVAEGAVRALEPALPAHRLWFDTLPAVHLRRMRAIRRVEGGRDVVFAGASVVHASLDPALVREASGLRMSMYNASLHRGFLSIVGPWLEWSVVPCLRPKVLVVGLTVGELNVNGRLQVEEPALYRRSLMGRPDAVGAAARRLEPLSAAFRHHQTLLRPRNVLDAVHHRRAGTVLPDDDARSSKVSVGPNGEWTGFHGRTLFTTENMFKHVAEGVLGDYEVGEQQIADLERRLVRLQRQVPLLIATCTPLSSQVPDVLPRGLVDLKEQDEIFADICERIGVPMLRPEPDLVDEEDFADFVHVNEKGARKISDATGRLLAEVLGVSA